MQRDQGDEVAGQKTPQPGAQHETAADQHNETKEETQERQRPETESEDPASEGGHKSRNEGGLVRE
jgi:hypothetical protein